MNGHRHGPSGHTATGAGPRNSRYLAAALALILAFMAVEVLVGIIASSLALISDAGHMLTDAAAIALALIAARLASRPAGGNLTFGWKRVEILSAQANGITLWLLTAWFLYQAIQRLIHPPDVAGGLVLVTALVGTLSTSPRPGSSLARIGPPSTSKAPSSTS
jgi:cobalt-zinc-cadmium efflux system protein